MDAREAAERADHLLDLGRAEEAVRVASTALAAEPESVDLLLVLGRAHQHLDRARDSLDAANRAIGLDPDLAIAHVLAAEALLDLHDPAAALRASVEAVRLEPDSWATHYTVARASLAPGRFRDVRQAEQAAQEALRLAPHRAEAHDLLGIVLGERGRSKEATAAHQRALALDPGNAHAMRNLTAEAMNRGRLGRAGRSLRQALAMAPSERILHEMLDLYFVRLLMRLLWVWVGVAIALLVMTETDASRLTRAAFGVLAVVTASAFVLQVARHLPRHRWRWFRGLVPRMSWSQRLLLTLVASVGVALGFLAFAPREEAQAAGIVVAVVFRILVWALVFAGVRGLWARLRRWTQR